MSNEMIAVIIVAAITLVFTVLWWFRKWIITTILALFLAYIILNSDNTAEKIQAVSEHFKKYTNTLQGK